jgi:acyl-CoA oxidase
MTTATWDDEKKGFLMHTPSTSAIKWWIGELGLFANHAIIFAQLIIRNKKFGVHAFLVPIRD